MQREGVATRLENPVAFPAALQITCYTTVGAGAALSWFVSIDGQASVSPTTSYGVPVISRFEGPGSVDASTDGGDAVTLFGRYFSTAVSVTRNRAFS